MPVDVPECVRHHLRSASRHEFEAVCHGYLSPFLPKLARVVTLGSLDCAGVDLCSLNENDELDEAIQCKGLEVEFSDSSKKSCLDSIDAFKKSGRKAKSYRLLLNRPIKKAEHRVEIKAALKALVSDGIVKNARLMPIEMIYEWLAGLATAWIVSAMKERWRSLRDDYVQRMETRFHIDDVPSKWGDGQPIEGAPISIMLEETKTYITGLKQQDSAIRLFVVGEFGFGKTTLLLRFFEQLERRVTTPIYAPVTQFENSSFSNEKSFISALLVPLLEDKTWAFKEKLTKLLRDTLAFLLRSPFSATLLLDGLDEHPYLYRAEGISTLMNCLSNFNSQVVLTLRKEFWDDRAGDFRAAFDEATRHNKRRKVLMLEDWGLPQLEDFVSRCENFPEFDNPGFAHFADIIRSGSYLNHYGDIPQRPLFLNMLAEEAVESAGDQTNIAILYYKYFRRKITRDQYQLVVNPMAGRPLVLPDEDMEQRVGAILDALTAIAGKTVRVVVGEPFGSFAFGKSSFGGLMPLGGRDGVTPTGPYTLQLQAEFSEAEIQQAARLDSGLLVANSLLIPTGPRRVQGISYRFAHKSFQEWFAARWMRANPIPDFPVSMPRGLMSFRLKMNDAGDEIP